MAVVGRVLYGTKSCDIGRLEALFSAMPDEERKLNYKKILSLIDNAVMAWEGYNEAPMNKEKKIEWEKASEYFRDPDYGGGDREGVTELTLFKELVEGKIDSKAPAEPLPLIPALEKLTEGKSPVLRKWTGGKYKCNSLERFIKAYQKIADDLTPDLIRDYLISSKKGTPYTHDTIEQRIKEHRT